ncbi:52 kDa repressor of the inhibitor of the protein kinase-like [Amblyomma americanum]
MPRTCCVPGCRSGYRGNEEKVSMFCLPSDSDRRVKWKRAIPRQETSGFSFDSPHVRVCEKHFDASDIVRADQWVVDGVVVTSQCDVPKLSPDAVPRIFEGLPAYLSNPKKRRTHSPRQLKVTERRREPSADLESSGAAATMCSSSTGADATETDAGNESRHACALLLACRLHVRRTGDL